MQILTGLDPVKLVNQQRGAYYTITNTESKQNLHSNLLI